jgi:hypothetical protein
MSTEHEMNNMGSVHDGSASPNINDESTKESMTGGRERQLIESDDRLLQRLGKRPVLKVMIPSH